MTKAVSLVCYSLTKKLITFHPALFISCKHTRIFLMAQTRVHIRTIESASAAVGWSGPRTVTIDESESAGGLGIGFNGGALASGNRGMLHERLVSRSGKRNLLLKSVRVDVEGDWDGDPVRLKTSLILCE